ncbi:hypothetical protein GCM10011579_068160 [Streptomyces albiflavescens]|uniref:Insecticide toxin TcdB middle/N-terminal domain-containing protein n=1 Tax=Streptomyces albiflavescens TaxID=1623582 RepID=A0A917Y9X6_9ACTN|nr:hypothetical protein GCM10011579_068160 [Streptomyces albiflavescens]
MPAPALPKGGLAVHGLGERLAVNTQTGGCSLSIPLALSAGRGASSAELALGFQSGGGRSPYGWAWDIAVPRVSRRAVKALPTYTDADTFVLSGFDDLVPTLLPGSWQPYDVTVVIDGQAHRVQRFRPRTDDTRIRAERCTNLSTGNVFWRTVDQSNVVMVFGRSREARITDPADPTGQCRVFQWLLEEVRDDRGNIARYEYKREDTAGVAPEPGEQHRLKPGVPPQSNRYLKRIRYANATPGDAASGRLLVVFDYGEHDLAPDEVRTWPSRLDGYSDYRAGFEIRTWRLCRRVMMFHDFGADLGAGPTPRLVRTIELTYQSDRVSSLLTAVRQVGYRWNGASYDTAALPPVEFRYSAARQADQVRDIRLTGVADGARMQFVDLDGDGLPGVLASTPAGWWYQRPAGDAAFDPPVKVDELPPTGRLDGVPPPLRDVDGSGRIACVAEGSGPVGTSLRRPDGSWERFHPYRLRTVQDLTDSRLQRVDLDGDGVPDLLCRGPDEVNWTTATGQDGYGATRRIPTAAHEEAGPRPPGNDAGHAWFASDMSGDGLVDLVRVRNGSVDYWPNLGWGRFGGRVTMTGTLSFDSNEKFNPERIRLADLDGSGTADLLYLGDRDIKVWLNQSGTGWSPGRVIAPIPAVDNLDELQVLDLVGAGTPCLVWTTSSPSSGPVARYLDLAVDGRPRQLRRITNNLGAQTTIAYNSSVRLQLQDRRIGRPWRTTPAFPVEVISRVEVTDQVAGTRLVTLYHFRDGYFDPVEREFRGFGYAESSDAESLAPGDTFDLPPTRTCEWFHTGDPTSGAPDHVFTLDPQAAPLASHELAGVTGGTEFRQATRALSRHRVRSELYVDDGGSTAPVTVTESRAKVVQLQPSRAERPAAFRVEPLESLNRHYERTMDDPRITHELTLESDDHGTPTSTASLAYPRRIPVIDEQNHVLITWTRTDLVSVDAPETHRISVPTATREYEITGLAVPPSGRFVPADLVTTLPGLPDRDFTDPPTPGLGQRRLVSATRYEYWNDGLTAALPFGQVGSRALPRRLLRFALTPQLVASVFGTVVTSALLSGAGGYAWLDNLWWTTDGIRQYDPAACYLPTAHTSPFGNTAQVAYDSHHLLVTAVRASTTAPLSLNATNLLNDYQALAPRQLTDPHGTRDRVAFDPLGRVVKVWRIAADGSGDTDILPGVVHSYGSDAWQSGLGPAWSHTATREQYADPASGWQEQHLYIDGLGRVAMTKSKAEPGEAWADDGAGGLVLVDTRPNARWLGTGRTVFNNKGLPVEQYEPYFAAEPAFDTADALVKRTVSQRRHYDALGRIVRIDHPDGTVETVEFGPWQQVNADRNDTVLSSDWYARRQGGAVPAAEARAAALTAAHADTPTTSLTDALGRVVRTRADNGPEGVYETRFHLDLAGNITAVDDARGVRTVEQLTDAAGRIVSTDSVDAGRQRALPDATGRHLRHWTANGDLVSCTYDLLGRPTHLLVRAAGAATDRLAEYTVYGEQHPQAVGRHLIGQVHRRYDRAGLSRAERYDLASSLTEGSRQLLTAPDPPDWSPLDGRPLADLDALALGVLDPETFTATARFDALGRPVRERLPDGTELSLDYQPGGMLTSISARLGGATASTPFITGISYDARRRRTGIRYANGVASRYDFDAESSRLVSLSSRIGATVLQDLAYTYDPVGNVVQIDDHAAQNVFFAGAVVTPGNQFRYDSVYRLRTASGREHASLGTQPDGAEPAMPTLPHPNDANALRNYTENYSYDSVGNLTAFGHAATAGSWTRRYLYAPGSNRLTAHQLPGDPAAGPYSAAFDHDGGGNTTRMPHLDALGWDHADKLETVDLGGGGTVTFHYDGGGNRVRKIWQRIGALREERIYLGEYELFRRYRAGVMVFERRIAHILDGDRRAALVETVTVDTDHPGFDSSPRIRFQLADKLGSSALECDDAGAVISYEEYHPFGTTSLWLARDAAAVSVKRYRYTGREKDTETRLCSFGARYYAPWLGRWLSPDLAGLADGVNRYSYVDNNPVRMIDETGLAGEDDAQLWLSESRGLWAKIRATATTRGFTKALKQYFKAIHTLWGGPAEYDIGHMEKPFALLAPGEESAVGLQNRGPNRSQGASLETATVAEAKEAGLPTRDPVTGHYPGATKGVRYEQPAPPEVGGIGSKPLSTGGKTAATADEAAVATTAAKPPPTTAPAGGPGPTALKVEPQQLDLPFNQPTKAADVAADGSALGKSGTAVDDATAVSKAVAGTQEAAAAVPPAPTAQAAPAVQEATSATQKAAPAIEETTAVSKAAAPVEEATALGKTAPTVGEGAAVTKAAPAVQEASALAKAAPVVEDAQAVAKVAKSAAPIVKEAAPVVKQAGTLSKVTSDGVKLLKAMAPAAKVVGEVAKPLGVIVAAADLATANNNTDRLVASGDLAAGVAMYCGPVGEAFSVGYTVGGLADKGIEKASKALVGVDLSPSNGIAHSLDASDRLVSALVPDNSSKPAYKNQNKVAWFLIDTLGF